MNEPSVRVVRRDRSSDDTPQTPGLLREVAFDSRNPDAKVLSAFLTTVLPAQRPVLTTTATRKQSCTCLKAPPGTGGVTA